MVTSDTSQSPGTGTVWLESPGRVCGGSEDTSPPLPLQDPTRGAETMQRQGLSEAASPHLRHRVRVLRSLRLTRLQTVAGEAGQYRKTVLVDPGNGHSGRLSSHLLSLEVSKPPFCPAQSLDIFIQRPDPDLFLTSPLKDSETSGKCVCFKLSSHRHHHLYFLIAVVLPVLLGSPLLA